VYTALGGGKPEIAPIPVIEKVSGLAEEPARLPE
jgi:hypothetical protein